MCIEFLKEWFDEGFSFLVVATLFWYSGDPTGIMIVLLLLNLAPEARHHLSRVSIRASGGSSSAMKMAASSANRDIFTL